MQWFQTVKKTDVIWSIRLQILAMHTSPSVNNLIFVTSCVKQAIDNMLWVTRLARSDKTNKIVTYLLCKNQQTFLFLSHFVIRKNIYNTETFHSVNLIF